MRFEVYWPRNQLLYDVWWEHSQKPGCTMGRLSWLWGKGAYSSGRKSNKQKRKQSKEYKWLNVRDTISNRTSQAMQSGPNCKKLVGRLRPQAPENQSLRSVVVSYSCVIRLSGCARNQKKEKPLCQLCCCEQRLTQGLCYRSGFSSRRRSFSSGR